MFPAVSLDVAAALKTLVLTLDLVGTFVFALSGATAGVRRRLDIFGVLVLSFVAANSGGIVRDLLIGATPPAAISDWRYVVVSALAGVLISSGIRNCAICAAWCWCSTAPAWRCFAWRARRKPWCSASNR
jgi:uncharacterized membrane protein YeiH